MQAEVGMHQCLRIPEIQGEIFSNLQRRDCAKLAQTCRFFYDQAMDVVWAELPNLLPVVLCLPSDAVDIQVVRMASTQLIPTAISARLVCISPTFFMCVAHVYVHDRTSREL